MLIQRAQTGQVRDFGWELKGAGKSPASNMIHTELPSALSPVWWCKPGKRLLEFSHSQDALVLPSKNQQEACKLTAVLRRIWGCGSSWEAPKPQCNRCLPRPFPTYMHRLVWLMLDGKALASLLSSLQLWFVVSILSWRAPECAAAMTQSQLQASSHLASK